MMQEEALLFLCSQFSDPMSKKTGNSLAVWIFFCIFVTDNIWLVSHYYGMDTDNMLSVLESYTFETTDDVAMKMAEGLDHFLYCVSGQKKGTYF